jgi:hypothetical protein
LQLILQQAHALMWWVREGGSPWQQNKASDFGVLRKQIIFVGKWIHILLLLLLLPRLFVTSKRSSFKYEWRTELDEVDAWMDEMNEGNGWMNGCKEWKKWINWMN